MRIGIVEIDETMDWNQDALRGAGVTRVVARCGFNADEKTHCCELTPSYWLEPFDVEFEGDVTDENRERFDEEWRIATEPFYMHCYRVDGLKPEIHETGEDDTDVLEWCVSGW